MGKNNLDAVFIDVEDFCQTFLPTWKKYLISSGVKERSKPSHLLVSEVMTIVISFHQSWYLDFKTYYIHFVYRYLTNDFPELVSYTRMLKLMQGILALLYSYLTHCQAKPIEITFGDFVYLWSNLVYSFQSSILMIDVCFTNAISKFLSFDDIRE
uniref:hypothetical protein n=1 Tax=Candidatus Enterovibrio escicola TaxID=1927127 RepID=UPI0012383C99|nr:hypothetical protein [Candidatus Enterovibrio escacola]